MFYISLKWCYCDILKPSLKAKLRPALLVLTLAFRDTRKKCYSYQVSVGCFVGKQGLVVGSPT